MNGEGSCISLLDPVQFRGQFVNVAIGAIDARKIENVRV
jgi:hypothetical protein